MKECLRSQAVVKAICDGMSNKRTLKGIMECARACLKSGSGYAIRFPREQAYIKVLCETEAYSTQELIDACKSLMDDLGINENVELPKVVAIVDEDKVYVTPYGCDFLYLTWTGGTPGKDAVMEISVQQFKEIQARMSNSGFRVPLEVGRNILFCEDRDDFVSFFFDGENYSISNGKVCKV